MSANARGRLPDPFDFKIAHVYQGPHGRDPRVRRTIDVLARKGFLRSDPLRQPYRGLLTLTDVLWVCEHVAPCLYEVLPAAWLRFPKHLPGPTPDDLRVVAKAMRAGDPVGPDFRGYPYHRLRYWLDAATKDGRASRHLLTRVHVKLPPELAGRMRVAAASRHMTVSAWLAVVIETALPTSV